MNTDDKNWYVVYTHPNAEKKLYQQMTERQLEAYLPLQRVVRQWSDRKKVLYEPLFKSYVFVYIGISQMKQVQRLVGFAQFIRFGGYPVAVAEQQINLVRVLIDSFEDLTVTSSKLKKGDKVKIFKGPLAGYEGVLSEDQQRAKLALEIKQLNQTVLVTISDDHIVKI